MELIKEIFEKDIGFSAEFNKQTNYTIRKAARIVLLNKDNKIAILSVKKGNYHKLPGGGIEFGENVKDALEREVKEEVGANINIAGELGMIIEYKEQHQQLQFSYCYYGFVCGEISAPNYTEQEKQDDFSLNWIELKSSIECFRHDSPDSYIGKFIKNRDLSILLKGEEILNNKLFNRN